jgi:hypothetical protein
MPLSSQLVDDSFTTLKTIWESKGLSDTLMIERLKAINDLAAKNNILLGDQSEAVIDLLMKQLNHPHHDTEAQKAAVSIFAIIKKQLDDEKQAAQHSHRAAGHFDTQKLYQRAVKDQMQDHDVTQLMPKSHGSVEVLGVLNRSGNDYSSKAIQKGISEALANKHIEQIYFPVGPGHWRGVYLSKPKNGKEKYELELFDPFGPSGAVAIKDFTVDLLKNCGIKADQLSVHLTGPTHQQNDFYACGDFVCAYSNKKMKESGAAKEAYNAHLIEVLERHGNQHDLLRDASRQVSSGHVKATRQAQPDALQKTQKEELPPSDYGLTQQEKLIFDATLNSQTDASKAYKEQIASLIKSRQSIFDSAAKVAGKKEGTLSSEELAAKLQAEELTKAGFKP